MAEVVDPGAEVAPLTKSLSVIAKASSPDVQGRLRHRAEKPPRSCLASIAAFLCLVALLGGLGWWAWRSRQSQQLTHFDTRLVDQGPINEIVLTTGTLQPMQTVTVGSQISGQILSVYVDYNSQVKKGQLLARIDPSPLQAQRAEGRADVANAEGGLQSAEASILNARTGIDAADAGIDSGRAGLSTAQASRLTANAQLNQANSGMDKYKAQVVLDRLTYGRDSRLLEDGFITVADVDTARATVLKSEADLANARAQAQVAMASIVSAEASIRGALASQETAVAKRGTADAQLQTAQAQRVQAVAQRVKAVATLGQIEVNLGYAEIRAPVDGVIISRLVDPGQTVAASFQTPALFLVATDLRHMQVKANVDESDISRIFLGQSVSFTVNAWPNRIFSGGRVVLIRNAPLTVQNVVTYEVLINIDNDKLQLRPGMTASLTMSVADRPKALRVSNSALRFNPEDAGLKVAALPFSSALPHIWLVNGTTLRPLEIKTGITDGALTELLDSNLKAGDAVVVGVSSAKASSAASTSSSPAASSSHAPRAGMPRARG